MPTGVALDVAVGERLHQAGNGSRTLDFPQCPCCAAAHVEIAVAESARQLRTARGLSISPSAHAA